MRVVAIDQGTTSTRALVLEEPGAGKILCTRTHKQHYPKPGWVEHDPEELLCHVIECLEAAGCADAIGIGNQGESCLAWDSKTGKPVSPVIVWQDRRTNSIIERMKFEGAEDLTIARAGLPLDPYFSASKLAWIVENIPEANDLLSAGRLRLGTTDAFFIDRLTGRFVTDITTASRTSLLDLEAGQWDPDLCRLFCVPIEALPEILPTMGDFGSTKVNGREVPLTVSVVDQQAALYGHGCRNRGDAKITFGTGAFALAVTGDSLTRVAGKGLLPTAAWQRAGKSPVYGLDGGVYCAGSALNWAKSLGLFSDFNEINAFYASPAIERKLTFVPALSGLACPYWDSSAAGLWLGLSLETTAPDMMQAMLEGIAFRAGQVIDAMGTAIAIRGDISIDGGMSSNPYFCQFLANVLQKRVVIQATGELTAFGVAQMAMGGASVAADPAKPEQAFDPVASLEDGKSLFTNALNRSRDWRN